MSKPTHIIASAPVVEVDGASERITLRLGRRTFTLLGDATDPDVRGLAVALHMAEFVTLTVKESDKFSVPEVFK